MITSGRHVPAPEAKQLGILDHVQPDRADFRAEAIAFADTWPIAARCLGCGTATSVCRKRATTRACSTPCAASIARRARNQKAPYNCIAAVEAACTLPIDAGLKREQELFAELENSDEARALRYAFFAEREVAKLPDIPEREAARLLQRRGDRRGDHGRRYRDELRRFRLPVRIMDSTQQALNAGWNVMPLELRHFGPSRQPDTR